MSFLVLLGLPPIGEKATGKKEKNTNIYIYIYIHTHVLSKSFLPIKGGSEKDQLSHCHFTLAITYG